ncbi:MAG: HtaA domain-containing protein [Gammaproteobacteria bacterium]|nr:HtaA domain-containing protein [Gammaproteobacteria bacterium]
MKRIFFRNVNFLSLGMLVLLTACSSGGGGGGATAPTYSGVTTPAAVSASNAEEISTTATEATEQAIVSNNASNSNPLGVSITGSTDSEIPKKVAEIVKKLAAQIQFQNIPAAITISYTEFGPDFCGGSVTVPDSAQESTTMNFTMTVNNLCYDAPSDGLSQAVMNGQVQYTGTETTFTVRYINFTVTMDGQTHTLNLTMTCDDISCTYLSDYVGDDGSIYRVENFNVSGDDVSGYTVSATFYHPTYGSVDITTTSPILFNCSPNPQPGSGSLSFTGSGGTSGSITFDSCAGYTYCYDDGVVEAPVCASGTW